METALLAVIDLPDGFTYPPPFIRTVELGVTNLEPWWVLTGDELRERYEGLRERYRDQAYVPFAARQDNDDIACWDAARGNQVVVIVHDLASPGWERRGAEFPDFYAWLRAAVDDFIEFE